MPCPRTKHLSNVPRFRGEKHDIYLKILHQAGFETARQAATSAERHALTIAPCTSLKFSMIYIHAGGATMKHDGSKVFSIKMTFFVYGIQSILFQK